MSFYSREYLKKFVQYMPTIGNLASLKGIYNVAGPKTTALVAAGLSLDKVLSVEYEKHHLKSQLLSSAALYGSVAFKAVSQILTSNLSTTHKTILTALTTIAAGALTLAGKRNVVDDPLKDIFESLTILAEFADRDGAIKGLQESYKKGGNLGAAFYAATHKKALAGNPYINSLLLYEFMTLAKVFAVEKYFPMTVNSLFSVFLEAKTHGATSWDVLKPISYTLARQVLDIIHVSLTMKIKKHLEDSMESQLVRMLFINADTQVVLQQSQQTKNIKDSLTSMSEKVFKGLSSANQFMFTPSFYGQQPLDEVLNNYPGLLLAQGFNQKILPDFIFKILESLKKHFISSPDRVDVNSEFSADGALELPGGRVHKFVYDVERYAYDNLVNVLTVSGGPFVAIKLDAYNAYIRAKDNNIREQTLDGLIGILCNVTQEILNALAYLNELGQGRLDDTSLMQVESQLHQILSILGLYNEDNQYDVNLKEFQRSLDLIRAGQQENVANRIFSGKDLQITNYHVAPTVPKEANFSIDIPELTLKPGNIYVLTGRNGAGKTTLLTDIAQCLKPDFKSTGTISYPSVDGVHKIPQIYCGDEFFAVPGTTILERISYRLPQEYVKKHQADLKVEIISLCNALGDLADIISRLDIRNVKLSPGQEKAVILLGALIYKKYIDKHNADHEVLLILDETFANLHALLRKKFCLEIMKTFANSIVCAVDHEWDSYVQFKLEQEGPEYSFYSQQCQINLMDYRTEYRKVIGQESTALPE